jgi:hypothetical protein
MRDTTTPGSTVYWRQNLCGDQQLALRTASKATTLAANRSSPP